MEKHAILIAGPNGAGKTTFARQVLPLLAPGAVFLNADEIQHEGTQFMSPVSAGRELLRRLAGVEQGQQSFALETTLASTMYVRRVAAWRTLGFGTAVHFIELPSADYAVERVRRRALLGGHSIPEEDVRRRFLRGLRLFSTGYKPLVDEWYHWFSDDGGLRLVDYGPT